MLFSILYPFATGAFLEQSLVLPYICQKLATNKHPPSLPTSHAAKPLRKKKPKPEIPLPSLDLNQAGAEMTKVAKTSKLGIST